MNKRKYFHFIFSFLLIAALVSAGCGSGNKSGGSIDSAYDTSDSFTEEIADSVADSSAGSTENISENVTENRKIIERLTFSLQTKEFDSLIQKLEEKVNETGGYIESSSIDGRNLNHNNFRFAELIVRIPSSKSETFSTYISENSTVINKEVSTEDVTLAYVDTESRLSALNTEKASLENLLANAQSVSDIITIRDRLTEVIYEIESCQSQLRTYDNLIDFTTITIYVDEVEQVQIVEEQTIWEEIGTNLANNVRMIGNFFVELFVVLASGLPFLAIIAIIVIIIIIIVKKSQKKAKKKTAVQPQVNTYGFVPGQNETENK